MAVAPIRDVSPSAILAWRPRRSFGFGARLGLATSALIVVVCVLQSWILARRDLEQTRRYLTERGRAVTEELARESGTGVFVGNAATLQTLAEEARAKHGIVYARFFDAQGLVLVSIGTLPGRAAPPRAFSAAETIGPIPIDETLWEFQAPVYAVPPPRASGKAGAAPPPTRQRVGTVALGTSVDLLHALRRETFRTTALFTALFTLVAIAGAALLSRAITRPLRALAAAADRIAGGDLTAKVTARGQDEIGRLAGSFNAMVDSLALSRVRVEDYSRTLEEKIEELETANRLKSEFLTTVSHELRTPLNVITGYADILAEGGAGAITAEQAAMLAAIRRYSKMQLELVTNVLDFSRLSAGRIAFQSERFTIEALIADVQALYESRLREAGLRLSSRVEPGVAELETDRVKLQEVVGNLVDNAVKFTQEGTIWLSARPGAPRWVVIEVTDPGTGIGPDDLDRIFDPFHQAGESSTRTTGGVGLGLSIVKRLTEALGGTVSVESRIGEGSTFRVEIPCRLPMADGQAGDAEGAASVAAVLDEVERTLATRPRKSRSPSASRGARRA
jgi:signal transduction histidine kinase